MSLENLQQALFIDKNYLKAQSLIDESKEELIASNFKIEGICLFNLAISKSDIEAMTFLKQNGYDLNLKNAHNITVLANALPSAPISVIEHLIKLGANYNASFWGGVPLYDDVLFLERQDRLAVFNLFIQNGANPYYKVDYAYRIFHYTDHAQRRELGLIASNQAVIEFELADNPGYTALTKLDTNIAHTAKEWLASQTYFNEHVNFEFTVNNFLAYFVVPNYLKLLFGGKEVTRANLPILLESIPSLPVIDEILKVNALNAIDSKYYLLISPYSDGITTGFTYPINQDGLAKVALTSFALDRNLKPAYVHEAAHQAMLRVFQNSGKPYFVNDLEASIAYDLAIKTTLVNIYQFWFDAKIEPTDYASSYELGSFVYKTVTNDLVAITAPIKSLAVALGAKHLGDFAELLGETIAFDIGAYFRSFKTNSPNFIQEKTLVLSFLVIYENRLYGAKEEQREFAVIYPEALVYQIPESMESVFLAAKKYHDDYVTPALVGYINNHANNYLLEE